MDMEYPDTINIENCNILKTDWEINLHTKFVWFSLFSPPSKKLQFLIHSNNIYLTTILRFSKILINKIIAHILNLKQILKYFFCLLLKGTGL